MARLKEADSKTISMESTIPVNPAELMMAATLYTIEKQLKTIEENQKQILSFLETEKQAKIEGDLQTLTSLINRYKYSWDNEGFIQENLSLVGTIRCTASHNIISFQKSTQEILHKKKYVVAKQNVNSTYANLEKQFKYYRLSIYIYSLASLLEVLLTRNFKEDYIEVVKKEILDKSTTYRKLFSKASEYLENRVLWL